MEMDYLRQYRGDSPCPPGFDRYWENALEKLARWEPSYTLTSGPIQPPGAECFELWFTGAGGARIHAHYVRPRFLKKPCPAVLVFHGYGGHCGEWQETFGYAAGGMCAAFMDCRGQNGLSEDNGRVTGNTLHGHIIRGIEDGPEHLLYKYHYLDTVALARVIMSFEEVDETKVATVGGSQGGGLSFACAALEPRINRMAVRYPFLSDFRSVWRSGLGQDAYKEITDWFRNYDPAHLREAWFFEQLGYLDIQNLAPKIHCPVRMAIGLKDTICPPPAQFAAYNALSSRDKELTVYPDFAHETAPGWNDKVYAWLLEMDEERKHGS